MKSIDEEIARHLKDASTRTTLQGRVDEVNLRIALRLEALRKDAAL
jgi:hypothetical protein